MGIQIDETILFGAAIAIFIPLFVFFVKLIIEIGNIKGKLEAMCNNIEEHKKALDNTNQMHTDLRLINLRLDNIESELRSRKGAPVN